jgi:hypothetical protein
MLSPASRLPQVMCFLPSTAATVRRPRSANTTKSTGRRRATTGSHRLCVSSHQPLQPFAGPAAPTLPKVLVDAGLPQALIGPCGSWLASDAIAGKPAPTGYVFPSINRCNCSPARSANTTKSAGRCRATTGSDRALWELAPTGYVFPPINRCNRSPAPQRQHHQKCWSMPGYHRL